MLSHLSDEEIEQFLTTRLDPAGRKRVLRHLTAGCGVCSRKLVEQSPGRLLDEAAESRRRRASRDPLRDRAIAVALEQDARWRPDDKELKRSLALLDSHPQGYDGLTFRQVQALHGMALVEALLQRSWEVRFHDPKLMRWLAYNAVKAAESLRPEECHPSSLPDVQARAWVALAGASRVNEHFVEAESALGRARALLRRGSGDLRLLGQAALVEAAIRNSQRRVAEACELLDRAYRLYVKLEDRHLAGSALHAKAVYLGHARKYRQSALLYRQSLPLLDPDRDWQLTAVAKQGLITSLVGCSHYAEAGQLLLKSDLRQQLADVPNVRWVEGRLLAGLGKSAKAEKALTEVRDQFLGLGRDYTAAIVGLDLLSIWKQQGKYAALRATAGEIYGVFRNFGIRKEAAMARQYLQ